VAVGAVSKKQRVGVMGKEFPSWLPFLDEMGLRTGLVLVERGTHLDTIQEFVDNDCHIVDMNKITTYLNMIGTTSPDLAMLLVDGGPTSIVMTVAKTLKLGRIPMTQVGRRVDGGWTQTLLKVGVEIALKWTFKLCANTGGK
jgi:hypothetical protein